MLQIWYEGQGVIGGSTEVCWKILVEPSNFAVEVDYCCVPAASTKPAAGGVFKLQSHHRQAEET